MKELSIEEKAKRFDEALAMAKECITYVPDDAVNKYMLDMFPELEEDRDEKIRKALINFFDGWGDKTWDSGIKYSEVVAWLQKQGKHANFRNKIQIGDKVTRNQDGVLVNLSQLKRVAVKGDKGNNGGISPNSEWSEEDEYNSAFIQEALLGLDGDDSYREKCCKMADWLESLKEKFVDFDKGFNVGFSAAKHNQWKPSEEQMDTLKEATNIAGGKYKSCLNLLYQDLKKLKG